ncbi:MAG: ABC transporter ATP-binding protein [Clostridia bacterium]|nr:ABC transporter ATP-binding protein [Clostridia bacterium]
MTQQERQQRFSKPLLRIFISYYGPHRKLFFLDLFCALGIAIVDLLFPMVSRFALQDLLPQGMYRQFTLLIFGLVAAYVVRSVLMYIVTYWGHLMGVRMEADMRRDLFTHISHMSYRFYDNNRTGSLLSRIVSDLFDIVELAHHGPEDLFIAGITLVGSFILMLRIRWQLALLLIFVVPFIVLLTIRQRKRMSDTSVQVKETTAQINSDIESSISGARTAQAFTNEKFEVKKFNRGNNAYTQAKDGYYHSMATYQSGMEFMTSILNIMVIGVGGYFVAKGEMDLVDLIAFTLYVNSFLAPIRKLVFFFEQYTKGMAGLERFVELMRNDPEIIDSPSASDVQPLDGDVVYQNVTFTYNPEGDENSTILHNLSLTVPEGHKVAIVGPSGSGKTTLCQLLPRFYQITGGAITIGGHDIKDITLKSLRAQIGIVQQEVFIFADTILENIRYGRPDATFEEVVAAAKLAEIDEFIHQLPDGYNTIVGERGTTLSGGQRQRVSIARIFLKNPRIMILDEATSALDTATEVRIQRALDTLAQGRTSLIIAHRLSTIRNADTIVYLDQEGIREQGSHAELMAQNGPYRQLYEAQYRSL